MAIHTSNFGACGTDLDPFADRNGFVPEADDELGDLDYGADFDDECAPEWGAFRDEAVEATDKASAALADWREGQMP